ncbi:glycosyltransferase family 25 protein [Pseudoalteromonas spongiae]|uniref:glycosyltransferase family 25 protein n=1 Tax=Pseudoalteromonas spongiae TaxID=298657 RepID=UPI000C2D69B1|nr:glycosyltransferase family 25 protein [Pseudoalteromonas spongiae]
MLNQPKVFLINLDKSTERLKKSSERLAAQNIQFERIQAIDGTKLTDTEIQAHYSSQLNSKQYYRNLGYGEIGCFLSHRLAWQKIVEQKLHYAIVLEDDFQLAGDLSAVFSTIESLKFDWQLLKLAAYQNRTRPIKATKQVNEQFDLVLHKKPLTGCCAQAITYHAAKQLLAITEQFGCPVDTQIQRTWQTGVSVYSLMPFMIEQDGKVGSEITAACQNQVIKKHFFKRKYQQLTDGINHYKQTQIALSELI